MKQPNIKIVQLCLLLTLITTLAFLPCLGNNFVNADDPTYITQNDHIQNLTWNGIKSIFTSHTNGSYSPLTIFSFALEYHFVKLDPFLYHLTNLLLHVLNVLLVFTLILVISGQQKLAFVIALLFAVHPFRVESVAWATERKDVLSSLFYLGTLLVYIRHIRSSIKSWILPLVCFTFFILSVLAKPQAMSLILTLLAVDLLCTRTDYLKMVTEKVHYLAVIILCILYNAHGYAPYLLSQPYQGAFGAFDKFCLTNYSVLVYAAKTIIPLKLSSLYPYPSTINGKFPMIVYCSFAINLLIAWAIMKFTRNMRDMQFAFILFIATLLLPLSNIWFGGYFISDRFMYLPSIGLFYLLINPLFQLKNLSRRLWLKIYASIYISILFLITFNHCKIWKNSITLWTNTIEQYPKMPAAYNIRGQEYMELNSLNKAEQDFQRAINIAPGFILPYYNLGIIYSDTNNNSKAITYFSRAIELDPTFAEAYNNRAANFARLGNFEACLNDLNKALLIAPDSLEFQKNRAVCLRKTQSQ